MVAAAALLVAFTAPVRADAASCTSLQAASVSASGSQSTSPPGNALDGELHTGWANDGIGSWIKLDLGSPKTVCSIDIAWYRGDFRASHFVVRTSLDGQEYLDTYRGNSSGLTGAPEHYEFERHVSARYVKISVYGNTENEWAAIDEIRVQGYLAGNIAYTVQPGDTLYRIGQAYSVPWTDIAARNGITSPYLIYPGQKLDVNPLLAGKACTDGWRITGYFTPLEQDYAGTGTTTVSTDEGTRTFYKGFVGQVLVQGSGKTAAGDYLGHWGGAYHLSGQPKTSSGLLVKVGRVATDTDIIPYFTKMAIPLLPEPWNERTFTAADTGPGVTGKHVDIYTGLGLGARKEAFRITGANQTVCY
ncbi:MAG: discoidin domain-containing protein [Nitrososphaera sp.]